MKRVLTLTKFFLLCLATSSAVVLPFLETPKHDGVKRVCLLTPENFTSVINAAEIAVVLFKDPGQVLVKTACPTDLDNFAEVTAQAIRKKNILVCTAPTDIPIPGTTVAATPKYNSGDVYIFKNGQGKPYYGKRSTTAILSFLFKVNSTHVNVITGKIDKIAFDAVAEPKVVGFFMQGSPDYQAFEAAAALLSPSVRFYVAFDRVVAQHLKLATIGQISLVKPPSKLPVPCPVNPATTADIENFVNQNKGALLTKINEYNLHDPQLIDPTRFLVLAIGEQTSPAGGYFYHVIGKLLKLNANNTAFQKLNIIWIEPELFPTIYLMMDELHSTLGTPNQFPALGVVNITTLQSAWFNIASLNLTGDRLADEQNILLLQDFLNGVLASRVVPVKLGAQAFVKTPVTQAVLEGSDIVLECIVENPVGDCLWLKDGKNIGFNLARYAYYDWRGDHTVGDCSLKITGVQKGRDDGEWICEVTGDLSNPTLTSSPAKLVIAAAPASATAQKSEL